MAGALAVPNLPSDFAALTEGLKWALMSGNRIENFALFGRLPVKVDCVALCLASVALATDIESPYRCNSTIPLYCSLVKRSILYGAFYCAAGAWTHIGGWDCAYIARW